MTDARIALVTGSGSGIGRATALKFANLGDHVVVADINRCTRKPGQVDRFNCHYLIADTAK